MLHIFFISVVLTFQCIFRRLKVIVFQEQNIQSLVLDIQRRQFNLKKEEISKFWKREGSLFSRERMLSFEIPLATPKIRAQRTFDFIAWQQGVILSELSLEILLTTLLTKEQLSSISRHLLKLNENQPPRKQIWCSTGFML